MTVSDPAVARLLELLELKVIDRDIFQAPNPGQGERRLYGGQVASQALRAAAATVNPEHQVNSLHAYFLRPGRYGFPVTYLVDRIRDGASFSTRRIVALQDGEAILNLDASFHVDEPGEEFQPPSPVGAAPDPESLEPDDRYFGRHREPIDQREVEPAPSPGANRARWIRTLGPLPDDPVIHACVLTYMSDSGPVSSARRSIGRGRWGDDLMTASLDHNLWFHRAVRADEWLFYELHPLGASGARGLSRGGIWTQDGELAVSVTQEALLRTRRK